MSVVVGHKFDQNKLNWSLVPIGAMKLVVKVLMFGAEKYGENNWIHVENARKRYYDAATRHLTDWWDGETNDPESKMHHMAHLACNALFLLAIDTGLLPNTGKFLANTSKNKS